MSFDAGTVVATLRGRLDLTAFRAYDAQVKRSIANASSMERAIGTSSMKSSRSMQAVGRAAQTAATGGVLVLGAALFDSVRRAADFERSMRNVNSIAGLSETKFKSLSKEVLALAGPTAQAPKTLADGVYQLVSSGFNASQSLTILKASAVAATAGLTTTETATTAVAAALNAYHLPASKAGQVSDQLFQTVNRGVLTFDQLAGTIGQVLPFANSLHVGLGQVGASLSTMTKQGMSADNATTYLKNTLVAFLKPSTDLSAAIDKTGAASGEALIKQKGFQGALEAVIGTTDGTKSAIQALFPNIRASAAAFALTGTNAKSANADVKAFQNTAGATKKVFDEQSKSTAFAGQQLKASFQSAEITVGQALLPTLAKEAKNLSGELSKLAADGSLQRFGEGLAHGIDDVVQHIPQIVGGLRDIGSTAADVVGVVGDVAHAIDEIVPGSAGQDIAGLAVGLAGLKVAQVVVPGLVAVGNGIGAVSMAARTAPSFGAFAADIAEMIGPMGLVVAGAAALGTALVVLGNHESAEEAAARSFTAAKRAQAEATKAAQDAIAVTADTGLGVKQARLDDKQASAALDRARVAYAHGKISVDQYQQAQLTAQQASLRLGTAINANSEALTKEHDALTKNIVDSDKRRQGFERQIAVLQQLQKWGGLNKDQTQALETAQRGLNHENTNYIQALATQATAEVSRQRLMHQSTAITAENAAGVGMLIRHLNDVPATKQAKLLVDNQDALAQAGRLANALSTIGKQRTVAKILTNADSAQGAVLAFQAVLRGVPERKISNILTNAPNAAAEIAQLRAQINAVPTSKTVTITTENLTIDTILHRTRARGRSAGGAEQALVGEGKDPRETVINRRTGQGFVTGGPLMMTLGPDDYVIPHDPAYRGRALGLLQSLMSDMGVKAFAKGHKPGGHAGKVPARIAQGGVAFTDVQQRYQNAKTNLSTARSDAHQADQTVSQSKGAAKVHAERAAARAHEKAKRLAAAEEVAHRDFVAARKTDTEVRTLQSQINVLRDGMDTADKQGNTDLFASLRVQRVTKIKALLGLLTRAQHLAHGDNRLSLNEQVGQLRGDLVDAQQATPSAVGDSPFTDAEQAQLTRLGAALSVAAALTPNDTSDDKSALEKILGIEQGALTRVLGTPGATPAIIKAAADAVSGTRSQIDSLTGGGGGGGTADLQAQLDQANARAASAQQSADLNAAALTAGFGPSSGTVIHQTNNMLHPGSPQVMIAVARAAMGGISQQAGRQSPRVTI